MKLAESTLIENFIVEAKALGTLLEPTDVVRVIETVVAGTTDFLAMVKTKEDGGVLVFENIKGEMIMAAVVEYNDNADGDGQGNWNYYWTFNPKDIEGKRRYQISATQVHTIIAKRGYELCRIRFATPNLITDYSVLFATLMREFLEANAKDGEEFTVEHDGYFLATAAVEDGVVEKSFLPDGAMKRLIKDDAATEVAA
jgi:hypothetical protein